MAYLVNVTATRVRCDECREWVTGLTEDEEYAQSVVDTHRSYHDRLRQRRVAAGVPPTDWGRPHPYRPDPDYRGQCWCGRVRSHEVHEGSVPSRDH